MNREQQLEKALSDLLHVSEEWYFAYCERHNLTFRPHAAGQTPAVIQAREALDKRDAVQSSAVHQEKT